VPKRIKENITDDDRVSCISESDAVGFNRILGNAAKALLESRRVDHGRPIESWRQ
jgi:hypothetical protein